MTNPRTNPRTIDRPVEVTGVGLFTARPATVRFEPIPAGVAATGIMLAAGTHNASNTAGTAVPITAATIDPEPLHPAFANMPARSTNLVLPDGRRLATLEHALSALVGAGITHAVIRLIAHDSADTLIETPIMDGSALPFTEALARAGTSPASGTPDARPIIPAETLIITPPGSESQAGPSANPAGPGTPFIRIDPPSPGQLRPIYRYQLRYTDAPDAHASLQPSIAEWAGTSDAYAAEVAAARTFALDTEAATMSAAGLFGHLSARDMLVIAPTGPVDNALRFPDEPARHKLLDLIGDLALAGRPLLATMTADRSGHALNHRAAAALRAISPT